MQPDPQLQRIVLSADSSQWTNPGGSIKSIHYQTRVDSQKKKVAKCIVVLFQCPQNEEKGYAQKLQQRQNQMQSHSIHWKRSGKTAITSDSGVRRELAHGTQALTYAGASIRCLSRAGSNGCASTGRSSNKSNRSRSNNSSRSSNSSG